MVINLSKLISRTKALNVFSEIPQSIMLNHHFMVIKGLLEPANLLDPLSITYLLTNHRFLLIIMEETNQETIKIFMELILELHKKHIKLQLTKAAL